MCTFHFQYQPIVIPVVSSHNEGIIKIDAEFYNHLAPAVNDFTIENVSTVIPPGSSKACLQFLAIDDNIVENHEMFTMIAETRNPNDTVNGTTSIIIIDNDGKERMNLLIVDKNSIDFMLKMCPR